MKRYFYFMALALSLVACQTEELADTATAGDQVNTQIVADGDFVDVSYGGYIVKAQKVGDHYMYDDIILDITEDGRGNKAANKGNRWSNRTVYYQIASNLGSGSRKAIGKALDHYRARTKLKFVQKKEKNYIQFTGDGPCGASLGMKGGKQYVQLNGCKENVQTIIHEIMHAIGFEHEHQRKDRDNYITIHWNNTNRDASFAKVNSLSGLTPFDFESIVMYGPRTFSNNGKAVITKKNGQTYSISSYGLSVLDTRGIEKHYGTGAPRVVLKTNTGRYVSSEDGKKSMSSNRSKIGSWEKFDLWSLSNGKVALRGNNGRFVSSENGKKYMTCNRKTAGSWEQFDIYFSSDHKFTLRGNNGRYVTSNNGKKPLACDKPRGLNWEKFVLLDGDY